MEKITPSDATLREKWEGGFIIHTESRADTPSPVTPEHVFPVLDQTVLQHGMDIGRVVFRSIFPKRDDVFEQRYGGLPTDAAAENI